MLVINDFLLKYLILLFIFLHYLYSSDVKYVFLSSFSFFHGLYVKYVFLFKFLIKKIMIIKLFLYA